MGGSGTSIVGQYIYLAGNWNNGAGSTLHYRYNILADSWVAMAPVPVPIYAPPAAAVGTQTYLVGEGNPSTTYIYRTLSNSWTTGPFMLFRS